VLGDLDFAGQDDRQAFSHLADFEQGVARGVRAQHAKAAKAFDLRWFEPGKHLVVSRVDDRWLWHRHP
jgi:hypothetical protein